jgi:hypothetical protein
MRLNRDKVQEKVAWEAHDIPRHAVHQGIGHYLIDTLVDKAEPITWNSLPTIAAAVDEARGFAQGAARRWADALNGRERA